MARRPDSKRPDPHDIPPFALADAVAIKAIAVGTANADQQVRGMMWTIEILGRLASSSYCPGDPHGTDFNEGKRFTAATLAFFIKTPVDVLKKLATGEPPEPSEQG